MDETTTVSDVILIVQATTDKLHKTFCVCATKLTLSLQFFLIGNVLHILRRILSNICSCKQTILAILRKLLDHIVCVKECWAVVFNRIALTATFVATEIPKIATIAFPEAFFLKKYDDNKHLGVN